MLRKYLIVAVVTAALLSGLQAAEKPKIAMDQLQVEGEGLAQDQIALSNYLVGELQKTKSFAVVAGAELAELAKKTKAQPAAIVDPASAVQAGKLLKVNKVVWGKLSHAGQKFSFWLKMADVKTGKLLFSKSYAIESIGAEAKREFEKNTIIIAQDLIATVTGRNIGVSDMKIIVVGGTNITSMDAMSTPDVYVTAQVGDEIVGTTTFRQNSSNPSWNETFQCKYRGEKIKFAFFDRDLVKDEYIGSCILNEPKDGTYDIVNKSLGEARKKGALTVKFEVRKFEPVEP